jgi:hypothetical protein
MKTRCRLRGRWIRIIAKCFSINIRHPASKKDLGLRQFAAQAANSDGRRDTPHGSAVPAQARTEWLFLNMEFRPVAWGGWSVGLIRRAAGFPCRDWTVGASIRRHKSPRASPELRVKVATVALMPIVHDFAMRMRGSNADSPGTFLIEGTPGVSAYLRN